MKWRPDLGAWFDGTETHVRVWAPGSRRVEVILDADGEEEIALPLVRSEGDHFVARRRDVGPGTRYRFRLDGGGTFPDPASRYQPEGVHGPSEVIDAAAFPWTDSGWKGIAMRDAVCYELHVGTFSPPGTFAGVTERLGRLAGLGVTAIQLMPVASFAGSRNWGYDGVGLFAPSHRYGRPDDLRRLVDRAHSLGMAVLLDVVYNHLGPDGNYLRHFSPDYFNHGHQTAWGDALNFDGPRSAAVRHFFCENALHWIHEYHLDGLRFDATHAMCDDSPRPILAELAHRVRAATPDRDVLLIAEDHRNLTRLVTPETDGGWGLDGVWADDFHHQLRRRLAGDREGYFRDFTGSAEDIAETVRRGWFFCGQYSPHQQSWRGSDPTGLAITRFVHCLQNHDQVGNRAFGERLHHQIDPAAYRAASTLLLMGPATPLLFMGQEWGADTPFLYFTDHEAELGEQVTQGRRREFQDFSEFTDERRRESIPDPQAEATFLASRLDWSEIDRPGHAGRIRLYRRLISLRREHLSDVLDGIVSTPRPDPETAGFTVAELNDATIGLSYPLADGARMLVVAYLPGVDQADRPVSPTSVAADPLLPRSGQWSWETWLTTEQPRYTRDPIPPRIDVTGQVPSIEFFRASAVILRGVLR